MPSASRPLEIFVVPFLGPSHLMPLFEMSRLFAARGEHVTVFVTPACAALVQGAVDRDTAAGRHLSLFVLPLPTRDLGLPDGVDFSTPGLDGETSGKLYQAMSRLQPQLENLIETRNFDAIFSDKFHPWTADVAERLRIPLLVYHGYCIFGQSVQEAVARPDSPHWTIEDDHKPFDVEGLPDPITLTRSRLPVFVKTKTGPFMNLIDLWREKELKSYGVLVNGVYELESAYAEHYMKLMGHKVFHIGPTAMIHRNATEKAERFKNPAVGENDCLVWLNSQKPNSVLYVCFGSHCSFPSEQLMELALGLEASGHSFIWVVHGKEDDKTVEQREMWLPKGFEERIKERCLIIQGWAPQVLILEHPSVGGFLTHCGWNSVLEALCAAVPMMTLPVSADQFCNEKLVVQLLGIGLEVGTKNWSFGVDVGKKFMWRDRIEMVVRRLMDGKDEEVEKIREKVKELSKLAKASVEEGGSSHKNLTVLIQQLKQIRDIKGGD